MDFATEMGGSVVPIEVKSGLNVKAKSLQTYRDKYQPKFAVRFSLKPLEYNNGILNLSIYLAGMCEGWIEKYLKAGKA